MSLQDLLNVVQPMGLFDAQVIFEALREREVLERRKVAEAQAELEKMKKQTAKVAGTLEDLRTSENHVARSFTKLTVYLCGLAIRQFIVLLAKLIYKFTRFQLRDLFHFVFLSSLHMVFLKAYYD